jgi:hypothetical protein
VAPSKQANERQQQARRIIMSKKRIALMTLGIALTVPGIAFASHVAHCCGDVWCCLQHLGCC